MSKETELDTEQQSLSPSKVIAIRTGVNMLANEVHQTAINHGWWDEDAPGQTVGEKLMLIVSEVSEALESDRNHEPPLWFRHADEATAPIAVNGWSTQPANDYGILGKPEGIAAELADAIIRILDLCERHSWPISQALVRKHDYNLTREHRHGGKAY